MSATMFLVLNLIVGTILFTGMALFMSTIPMTTVPHRKENN